MRAHTTGFPSLAFSKLCLMVEANMLTPFDVGVNGEKENILNNDIISGEDEAT